MTDFEANIERHEELTTEQYAHTLAAENLGQDIRALERSDWGWIDLEETGVNTAARLLEYRLSEAPVSQRQRPHYHKALVGFLNMVKNGAGQPAVITRTSLRDVQYYFRPYIGGFYIDDCPSVGATNTQVMFGHSESVTVYDPPVVTRVEKDRLLELDILDLQRLHDKRMMIGRSGEQQAVMSFMVGERNILDWLTTEAITRAANNDYESERFGDGVIRLLEMLNERGVSDETRARFVEQTDHFLEYLESESARAEVSAQSATRRVNEFKELDAGKDARKLARLINREAGQEQYYYENQLRVWSGLGRLFGIERYLPPKPKLDPSTVWDKLAAMGQPSS